QPNGNDCGYYVMKNMLDIISANITKSWMEVFNDPTALTEDDLYDLRNQWATCFLDLYNA
ncbi:Ulp1 protease family, carboxy-terminal domain protein, partial [Medicago truncatula]